MRKIIAALAALCMAAAPASAQKDGPAPAPAALSEAPAAAPSPAAEAVARAFLVDSGVIDAAFDMALQERFASARQQFQSNPDFRRMTRARRDAALAVFDNLPAVMREEINRLMPAAVTAFAADIDREFQPAHLTEIGAYLTSSAGRKLISESISAGLRDRGQGNVDGAGVARAALGTMNDTEAAATMRFVTSEAGAAFAARTDALVGRLQTTLMAALTPALPVVMARVQTDLCAAMESDCPREMRP